MLESFLVYKYGFPSNLRAMFGGWSAFPLAPWADAVKHAWHAAYRPPRSHRKRAGCAPVLCMPHGFDPAAPRAQAPAVFA